VTFRTRVITATLTAAAIAVILACVASYLTTSNSLLHAVDESLIQASHQPLSPADGDRDTGSYVEIVLPSGETIPTSSVPIDKTIMDIAKGKASEVLRTVTIANSSYRELVAPLPANSVVGCQTATGVCQITTTSAELYVVNISGQINELNHLRVTLVLVALGGVLLALGLGLFLARQALHPLEEVTNEIESVATTNDLQYRLHEGGADELGRLRRVFNRLLGNVENSQMLQRQLVLDASHELRTPLTSLRTNAQVISRAPDLSADELRQIADDMVTQVDELAGLVTDLGELARGDKSDGEPERLRLDDCVDECIDTARTYARIRNITIDADVDTSYVIARHDRLNRAISNLLTNAVKFTPEGGRILVTTAHGTVTVADSGPGISDEDRQFVFDRFWRSPSARALPGSGLGLSIVAQVAAEAGGTVAVDRDPVLGGARFSLSLPEDTESF